MLHREEKKRRSDVPQKRGDRLSEMLRLTYDHGLGREAGLLEKIVIYTRSFCGKARDEGIGDGCVRWEGRESKCHVQSQNDSTSLNNLAY